MFENRDKSDWIMLVVTVVSASFMLTENHYNRLTGEYGTLSMKRYTVQIKFILDLLYKVEYIILTTKINKGL